jgi:ABC-type cobalamin/Fe3+-siderophores transport system ATPase subunit
MNLIKKLKLFSKVNGEKKRNTTIIKVAYDIKYAFEYSNKILIIKNGAISLEINKCEMVFSMKAF